MEEKQKSILRARCMDLGAVLRVLFWVTAALLVFRAGYGVWLLFRPTDWLMQHFSLTVQGADSAGAVRLASGLSCWWQTAGWYVMLGVLWCGRKIFRSIDRTGTPFCAETVRAVREIGIWVMIYGVLRGDALGAVYQLCGFSVAQRETLTRAGVQLSHALSVDGSLVNWGVVLLGGVVLWLSYVFAYGAYLQQETDELL